VIVTFKKLKEILYDVDRNTLETIVIKHLLRISADNINTDILYNAESEQTRTEMSDERLTFILKNKDNTCPDLYPQ